MTTKNSLKNKYWNNHTKCECSDADHRKHLAEMRSVDDSKIFKYLEYSTKSSFENSNIESAVLKLFANYWRGKTKFSIYDKQNNLPKIIKKISEEQKKNMKKPSIEDTPIYSRFQKLLASNNQKSLIKNLSSLIEIIRDSNLSPVRENFQKDYILDFDSIFWTIQNWDNKEERKEKIFEWSKNFYFNEKQLTTNKEQNND